MQSGFAVRRNSRAVTITFKPQSAAGLKTFYAIALNNEGLSSGYQQLGSWTVQ